MDKNYLLSLPKDVLLALVLDLNLADIISLCQTSSRIDKDVCKNSTFWRNKISKDFPNAKYNSKNPKQIYLKLTKIVKDYPELKDILQFININKFKFSDKLSLKIFNLIQSLNKNVQNKIIEDYNNEFSEDISEPWQIYDFIRFQMEEDLYFPTETEYYFSLINQIQKYPNTTFDPMIVSN